MFTQLNVGVFRATPEGRRLFANEALLNLFGFAWENGACPWSLEGVARNPKDLELILGEMERNGDARVTCMQVRGAFGRIK